MQTINEIANLLWAQSIDIKQKPMVKRINNIVENIIFLS